MIYHDVIVVGGGLAGLRAAIEVNRQNINVAVISKVHPIRSHSVAAQGGINAALGNHPRGIYDSTEKHTFDTIKGSDFLSDQDAVVRMINAGPERIYEMEHWGCPFTRNEEGKIAQRPFGGAGFPRTCFAADKTGQMLLHTLYEQTMHLMEVAERKEMQFFDEWLVTSLVVDGDRCIGVVALDVESGELEGFKAGAVIFATGGVGRIYRKSTNAIINTGSGMAIAYHSGLALKDMEFIQFHPTTLVGSNILITEGARGEGGFLINNRGERFLANYPDSKKAMEIAPRDIIARNMMTEILQGRGYEDSYLLLDLRHLGAERIISRLPGIREICIKSAGIDLIKEPIPVQPGQHYTMGGIDTNKDCETNISGFYAAGECACVSVHGANRLGGNSLLETIVFGAIAGKNAAEYVQGNNRHTKDAQVILEERLRVEREKIDGILTSKGSEDPVSIREEMATVMEDKVGIFRNKAQLKEAHNKIQELRDRYTRIRLRYTGKKMNYDLVKAIELGGSLDVAEAVIKGAIAREESRGSHFRTDFPERDDKNWLKHTRTKYSKEGAILDYSDVNLSFMPPEERKY